MNSLIYLFALTYLFAMNIGSVLAMPSQIEMKVISMVPVAIWSDDSLESLTRAFVC